MQAVLISQTHDGNFISVFEEDTYGRMVERELVDLGADPSSAKNMVSGFRIKGVGSSNVSTRITYGISRIDSTSDSDEDFYRMLVARTNKELKNRSAPLNVNQVQSAFEKVNLDFQDPDFRESLSQRAARTYDSVRKNILVPAASRLVKPQKAVFSEFTASQITGDLPANKIDYLARSVAQKLGINLTNNFGDLVDQTIISTELAKRGINSANTEQLRSFLVDQKLMTRPSNVGGFNIFGFRQVTVDKAFEEGIFSGLSPSAQTESRTLFGEIALQDPVSRTVGFSTVRGVYESVSGNIVDTTALTVGAQRMSRTLSQDIGLPIVKFNPLQMLGIGGPRRTDPLNEIQFLPGISRQDFLAGGGENAQVFAWVKEKGGLFGSVGRLFSISEATDDQGIKQIPGLFKAVSSIDTDIYARATRLATGRQSYRDSELTAAETGESLSRGERVRSSFDIDEEQPNSLVRRAQRFLKRKTDIRNESTLTKLVQDGEIRLRGGKALIMQETPDGLSRVVDEMGTEVYGPDETVRAFEDFRIKTQGKATAPLAMSSVSDGLGIESYVDNMGRDLGNIGNVSGSDLSTAGDISLRRFQSLRSSISGSGVDVSGLSRSARALQRMMEEADATSNFVATSKTSTIATRQDYLRNAIYRFNVEMAGYQSDRANPIEITKRLEQILQSLKNSGEISSAQLTEARAAGAGILFNLSGFSSYTSGTQRGRVASESLSLIARKRSEDPEFAQTLKSFFSPFTSQSISNVNAQGAGRYLNAIRPIAKRTLGSAKYELGPNAINPLGNAGTTFVPTLTTVLDRASRGETSFSKVAANVLGISSYNDPDSYSGASMPAIHLSERMNRYFETVGLGVQHENYSGPLSAFGVGYGLKRVLPLTMIGATAMTIDRTAGGLTNEKDERGERVYSPLVGTKVARGAVEVQSLFSGITPGGMGYAEKKEQLLEGEVPIKQGRFWPLGVTPFEGGKTMYHRPSYYRRLASGSTYTSDAFGSPAEKLAYGYDFSPLRPIDPYRFEREHYFDRPYPVSGEYFTGAMGPITPLLNMTVGKVLKPQVKMHSKEVANALSQYVPAGYSGAYDPSGLMSSGQVSPVMIGGVSDSNSGQEPLTSSRMAGLQIGTYNGQISSNVSPLNTARNATFDSIASLNASYLSPASARPLSAGPTVSQGLGMYGPPPVQGFIPPNIVRSAAPISQSGFRYQSSELGYRTQEMAGLYGFGLANIREKLGYGNSDFEPDAPVLQSASRGYGLGRSFWDLNLGGLGDIPSSESGIEFSEVVRRFIPKERTNTNYINPIRNTMGMKHPYLPGSDYFTNFQTGDPFTKVSEGELRLPGVAYERLNPTKRDYSNPVTQLDILSDVAPYSRQFRSLDRTLNMGGLEPSERVEVEKIRAQVAATTKKNNFTPYKYKDKTSQEIGAGKFGSSVLRGGEYLAHRDTFINTKFFSNKTAQEDWERRNVYGSTFPEWQRPIESFIKPLYDKSSQRNPVSSGLIMAAVGAMFGKKATTRAAGSLIGFSTGFGYSSAQNIRESVTGERFVPKERKKQLALEEYVDVLSYVKNRSLATQASESGDMAAAAQFSQASKRTMYGADIYGESIDTLSLAIPKRKREHFQSMIQEQDPEERERILSTAPRLERRIYQAAWGKKVEEKPDLVEYFSRHELPDLGWEGWHPNTNMEHVKVKVGQSMGINMAQMGYFPQQIREANSTNPSYPGFSTQQDPKSVAAKLRMIMSRNGISGNVYPVANGSNSSSINISAGIN